MKDEKNQKSRLVQDAAATLRDLILDTEPDAQIGSLNEVAQQLGVGIVTVQQAARILEHEGLLTVKRGPGGGYYGARPDGSAIERIFATYMRVYNFGYREAFEMMMLLDCDIIPAAAKSQDKELHLSIKALTARIEHCEKPEDRIRFENDLRETLFKVAERPFLELLARVTMQLYKMQSKSALFSDADMVGIWMTGRRRILEAISNQEPELARFEAERYRSIIMVYLSSEAANQPQRP